MVTSFFLPLFEITTDLFQLVSTEPDIIALLHLITPDQSLDAAGEVIVEFFEPLIAEAELLTQLPQNQSVDLSDMLDYALEYEIVDRNYSRTFKLTDETIKEIQKVKKEHIPFTDEEISKLWEHVDDKNFVDVMLIQCYSGWRPQELGLIELANVDLENGTFKGGIKTEAGEDRVVPIHSKIRYLVERHYDKAKKLGSPYLFNCKDKRSGKTVMMSYQRYKAGFEMIRDELNLNPEHRPHDGRKHFVTAAKKAGIDEYAIKYMVGHKISDITEKVYTQREFDWLKEEIEKIK